MVGLCRSKQKKYPRSQNRPNPKRCAGLLAALGCGLISSTHQVAAEDNPKLQEAIDFLTGAHNAALPTSLSPIPGVSDTAEAITYGTNILLKYRKAPLTAPSDVFLMPNSSDKCSYSFTLPQADAQYSNLLGIWDTAPLPTDWGVLGTPSVSHSNTDVNVGVYSLEHGTLSPDRRQSDRLDRIIDRQKGPQFVTLGQGRTQLQWEADTQVSTLFDYVLPVAAYGITSFIYGKAATKLADRSAGQALRQAKFQLAVSETLVNIGIELNLIGADMASDLGSTTVTNATDAHRQTLTVYDVLSPQISTSMESFELEATDFGGALYSRNKAAISSTVTASDPCGRNFSLSNDAPTLLPLGSSTLTWTVTDLGPNENFQSNTATLTQTVIVKDTQAPIMVPPAGKVIEVASSGISAQNLALGFPRVVDLADSQLDTVSNSPSFFPVNSRTEVIWQSTDDSGNSASASQWITVKEPGANNAPTVQDKSVQTLTAIPVDIKLSGSDEDFLDGRFDPLEFKITKQPTNGEFIAPLFPYFIEDFRTNPAGPLGEDFLLASPRNKWVYENYCRKNIPIPIDWIYRPRFMQVTDSGDQFVVDDRYFCNPSDATTRPRVSKWDKEGNYLGENSISTNINEQIVLDRDGNIYYTDITGSGSSTRLTLSRCSTVFGSGTNANCDARFRFNYSSAASISPGSLVYARVDSQRGLAFVTDKRNVFVFDIRNPVEDSEYLGSLMPDQFLTSCSVAGSSRSGFTIEIDSQSNLYIADSCEDRIHKFGPSVFKSSGEFVAGEYIGWLGRCESSTNKSCDEVKQRSKGYSCSDVTCTVTTTAGEKQGQFATPLHLALDPNDVLYVADYANRRIQRFSSDGTFAGEAVSTGTGINQGNAPGFILGNFDSPKTVSVNSTQFYIVDQAESFVHVFETSPLKEITDESAVVTYVSDFNFHSSIDSFGYIASDGLANSNEAQVSINVARSFRPPTATAAQLTTLEDRNLSITLSGDDPDGVIGSGDFNALDSLSFRVVSQPNNGQVVGGGSLFEYRPSKDFNGTDSFTFVANDGVFDSEPAIVNINVEAVNDPPRIELPTLDQVAVGFPLSLVVSFFDDDINPSADDSHQVSIDWGDGTSDTNASDASMGALVVSPATTTTPGIISANHVYKTTGSKTIRLCVTDSAGGQSCETESINNVQQVSLAIQVTPSVEEVAAGEEITYEVELFNLEPNITGNGLVADKVSVSHMLPQGLQLLSVTAPETSCSTIAKEVSCELGDLVPGESRLMRLVAQNSGTEVFDLEGQFNVVALTNTPTNRGNYIGSTLTTITADPTDSDNDGIFDIYERRYGLNVGVNDSQLDKDLDGLSNLGEFLARTSAESADSDGDGISDGWEVRYNLNPLSALDASGDNDGDGFTNLQEYLADRSPLSNERSGSRLVPILASFDNGLVFVPAVQVGSEYYDLQLEIIGTEPYMFQLNTFVKRNISVEVPDASQFKLPENILAIDNLAVGAENYSLEMQLVSDAFPFQFQLTKIDVAAVTP